MSLLKQFASNVNKHQWWQASQPVVVAVSTGVDSMVLLDLLQRLRYVQPHIIVAHVNHDLRVESDQEARYLKRYCDEHQLTLAVGTWPKSEHPDHGIENAARQFRYAFFERVMQKYQARVLLTAHHRNDQAETVLMKLMRGGDIEQLTGIQPKRRIQTGQLVRPLLAFEKQTIRKYAEQRAIKWYEDRTNQADDVTRNRVRHHLLPMMQTENARVVDVITNYADQLNTTIEANDWLLKQQLEQLRSGDGYDLAAFLARPVVVQLQILKWLGANVRATSLITDKQARMLVQLLNNSDKPQDEFAINSQLTLVKTYGRFKLENSKNVVKKRVKINRIMVRLNHWYRISDRITVGVFEPSFPLEIATKSVVELMLLDDELPLSIRPWQHGDRVALANGGHQKVSRVFINQKVPNDERETAMVLVDRTDHVLSVLGYKNAASVHSATEHPHRYRLIMTD
ncbi:tRNA lysidine(34) synthetase TilS [Lactobacillaceae bacterium Melli_B3]